MKKVLSIILLLMLLVGCGSKGIKVLDSKIVSMDGENKAYVEIKNDSEKEVQSLKLELNYLDVNGKVRATVEEEYTDFYTKPEGENIVIIEEAGKSADGLKVKILDVKYKE